MTFFTDLTNCHINKLLWQGRRLTWSDFRWPLGFDNKFGSSPKHGGPHAVVERMSSQPEELVSRVCAKTVNQQTEIHGHHCLTQHDIQTNVIITLSTRQQTDQRRHTWERENIHNEPVLCKRKDNFFSTYPAIYPVYPFFIGYFYTAILPINQSILHLTVHSIIQPSNDLSIQFILHLFAPPSINPSTLSSIYLFIHLNFRPSICPHIQSYLL